MKKKIIADRSSSKRPQFASYYGDHMVLQKAPKRALVWGYGGHEHNSHAVTLILLSNDGQHISNYRTTAKYSK